MSDKQRVQAKEQQFKTVRYSITCPACGDDDWETDESAIGETYDCLCGVEIEVVK